MYKIYKTVHLGSALSYENLDNKDKWFIVQATQDEYNKALYEENNKYIKSTDNLNWLEINNRLVLNLEDCNNVCQINGKAIEKALNTIDLKLQQNKNILVHCKFGMSRSASIVLLYLYKFTNFFKSTDFLEVEEKFKKIYPPYRPTSGIRSFVMESLANNKSGIQT